MAPLSSSCVLPRRGSRLPQQQEQESNKKPTVVAQSRRFFSLFFRRRFSPSFGSSVAPLLLFVRVAVPCFSAEGLDPLCLFFGGRSWLLLATSGIRASLCRGGFFSVAWLGRVFFDATGSSGIQHYRGQAVACNCWPSIGEGPRRTRLSRRPLEKGTPLLPHTRRRRRSHTTEFLRRHFCSHELLLWSRS